MRRLAALIILALTIAWLGPLAVTFNRGAPDRFYHSDAQGSRLAFSNSAGVVGARERYAPFGESLLNGAGMGNFITYTGHMRDVDTGLTYMQARFYDPVIGRFLSTDPIGYQDQLNLYAYVANDPVNKVDPTGEFAVAAVIPVARIAIQACASSAPCATAAAAAGAYAATKAGEALNALGSTILKNEEAKPTPLPEGLVGSPDDRSETKGRVNSGPLAPENGGTGEAEKDFGNLTGGQSGAPPEGSTLPEGSRVGENGIVMRPGAEGKGPRIDIPASGDKPRETLHYPPPEVKDNL